MLEDSVYQLRVEHADAARLDDDVGIRRALENGAKSFGGRIVHHRPGPGLQLHVAMLLPVIRVGLVESDLVPAARKIAQKPAIISRSAVPPRGQQARTVESNLHAALSRTGSSTAARKVSTIARSSSTR